MPEYASGTGDFTIASDSRATDYTDAGCDSGVRTNTHIVRNMYLVIEFATLLYHGVSDGSSIYRGIGAYLDVICNDYTAKLRNLVPLVCVHYQSETIGTDHHAGMQDTTISDTD
jgi:hypothetical protein